MKDLYVVNCCRTAIGSFGGSLKNTPAVDMGAIVVKEALKRANVAPENVDELMFGCILTAGQGQNPARQVSVKAGIPYSVPAYTVGMVCGSGMKSVIEAGRAIGLTFPQIFFNILLPQAVVQMIPPWINSATEMIKASTLLGMIGVLDLLLVTRQIVAKYGEALVYYLIIGVFYFAINTLIEYAGKKLSKKLNYLQKAKR